MYFTINTEDKRTFTINSPSLDLSALRAELGGGSLAAGTYYYVITATNSVGEALKSNEISISALGPNSAISLSWTAVTGATGYKIYRGTTAAGENTFYSVGTATTFTDIGTPGTAGTPPTTTTTGLTAPTQNAATLIITQTVGYITDDGNTLVMMGVINKSIITLAPYPPNVSALT